VFNTELPDNDIANWCEGTAESQKWMGEGDMQLSLPPVSR